MEYLALYRKYRPTELNEVVGQSEIKQILASSVKNETISHAYLFSGPRGTGKTTMAKIFAKMVNCSSPVDGNVCNKCESCLNVLNSNDVIEIDAASNNGVDEIRDLREKANLVPSSAKYKVYIIDEVHMLTTQAFNALLKTLEEPPKHVIFILATTEYYKIPLTITSRCQKFQFNKLTDEEIVGKLKEISKNEKIAIDEDALYEIAKISDGGMRDSINFLDQLRSFNNKNITLDDVYEVCGNISSKEIKELLVDIKEENCEKIVKFFDMMDKMGKNYGKFFEDLICYLKDVVLYKKNVNEKLVKGNIDDIAKIADLYDFNEIFLIVDIVNSLIDRLKNVSRQSVVVVSNFLSIMYKINNKETVVNKKEKHEKKEEQYDLAFDFTNKEENVESKPEVKDTILESKKEKEDHASNKEIVINNTFAVASKTIKNDLQKKYSKLGDYLTDKKFSSITGMLVDTNIEVAGEGYIIFSAVNDAVAGKIYDNYKLVEELFDKIFEADYNVAVITVDEWKKLRDEYIENINKGIKYTLKDLVITDEKPKEKKVKKTTVVDKLFDIVGEDTIEFK